MLDRISTKPLFAVGSVLISAGLVFSLHDQSISFDNSVMILLGFFLMVSAIGFKVLYPR